MVLIRPLKGPSGFKNCPTVLSWTIPFHRALTWPYTTNSKNPHFWSLKGHFRVFKGSDNFSKPSHVVLLDLIFPQSILTTSYDEVEKKMLFLDFRAWPRAWWRSNFFFSIFLGYLLMTSTTSKKIKIIHAFVLKIKSVTHRHTQTHTLTLRYYYM